MRNGIAGVGETYQIEHRIERGTCHYSYGLSWIPRVEGGNGRPALDLLAKRGSWVDEQVRDCS